MHQHSTGDLLLLPLRRPSPVGDPQLVQEAGHELGQQAAAAHPALPRYPHYCWAGLQ